MTPPLSARIRIPPLAVADADPATAALLQDRERKWGRSWNVVRTLAHAPAVLAMMNGVWDCLDRSTLSAADRELIATEMAAANGCHYCIPAHKYVARHEARLKPTELVALERVSRGEELADGSRLATLQQLVRLLVARKGGLTDEEYESFRFQGVAPRQMIETIGEIAHCTVTNFTNRLAGTPLDSFLDA
jgi:uncharacterized peroxidase-related enzyme